MSLNKKKKSRKELVFCKKGKIMKNRKKLQNITKKSWVFIFVFVTTIIILNPELIYAGGLSSSKAVTGTKNLLQDATKVVTILAPIVAGVMAGWNGLKLSSADDDEVKPIKKKIKICVIGGVVALIGGTMIQVILNYYK